MTVRLHRSPDHYPRPELVAPLRPFLDHLRDMAVEYDEIAEDGQPTSAVEFVAWVAFDVERAAERTHRNAMSRELTSVAARCAHSRRKRTARAEPQTTSDRGCR